MPSNPYAWFPDSNLKLHLAAAEAIRHDPSRIQDALDVLNGWLSNGDDSSRFLLMWQELLMDAMRSREALDRLLVLLEDDSEGATQMKSYSPISSILSCETIDRVYESCTAPTGS